MLPQQYEKWSKKKKKKVLTPKVLRFEQKYLQCKSIKIVVNIDGQLWKHAKLVFKIF